MIFAPILVVVQVVGILVAVCLAVRDIESIMVSGPVVSVIGLLVGLMSLRRYDGVGLLFGLSALSMSVLCLSVIYGLEWGPHEAALPISCLLIAYAILSLPAGAVAFRRLRRPPIATRRLRMQFQISTLLGLTFLVAVVFSLHGTFGPLWGAVGVMIAYSIVFARIAARFHDGRPGADSSEETSVGEPWDPGS